MREELEIRAWEPRERDVPEAFPERSARAALFAPRGEAEWDWAFRRNPAGTRLFLARRGGRVVARYGALPVRTRMLGETRVFAHVLDALHGDDAALLATARAFLAAHGGPEGDLLHYGWPDGRDFAFGQRHLEHELLRTTALLVREPGPGPIEPAAPASALARFGPAADVLYACCATHWHASALRDAAFLNWRFADHPWRRYRAFGVQTEGTLRGYAVYRPGPELHPRLALVMDWLVLPGDDEAAEALLGALLARARADGLALAGSFPEWSPWSLHFQERGFRHHPSEHRLVVRSAVPRFDMLWLRDNWWTTLADALLL
jgi:hypothetical protein